MKVAFSLLHYNNKKVTEEAVLYLLKLNGIEDCEIIIVDNASPNGTGKELQEEYKLQPNIHVIVNKKNGGFAYGNNIGYAFAKEIGCNVIAVMNNDIYIKDEQFIAKLQDIVRTTDSEIIAPHIIGRNGPQNPFRLTRLSTRKIKKMLVYNSTINILYHIPVINTALAKALELKDRKKEKKYLKVEDGVSCIPHGACVIYTDRWVKNEEIAFLPSTFMYFEEDILGEYLWQKKYKSEYKRDLVVYHVEDASVEYDNKTDVKKRKFISGCMKKSIKILYDMRMKKQ